MIKLDKDFYRLLGVRRTASTNEIKKAYKDKVRHLDVEKFKNKNDLREYYKQLDKALEVLTDINKRSEYDAMLTYMFLKDYAWTNQLLNENDLESLKFFWVKQRLNREMYKSLDFNKFTPEYDFSWYVPFYLYAYYQDVEDKEAKYTPSFYEFYRKRYFYIVKIILGILFIIFPLLFFPSNLIVQAGFVLLGIWLTMNGLLKLFQVISFWKSEKFFDSAKVVDKWVRLSQNPLTGKLEPRYFVAYDTEYDVYYQEVSEQAFVKLAVGLSVDVIMSMSDKDKVMISPAMLKFLSKKK